MSRLALQSEAHPTNKSRFSANRCRYRLPPTVVYAFIPRLIFDPCRLCSLDWVHGTVGACHNCGGSCPIISNWSQLERMPRPPNQNAVSLHYPFSFFCTVCSVAGRSGLQLSLSRHCATLTPERPTFITTCLQKHVRSTESGATNAAAILRLNILVITTCWL